MKYRSGHQASMAKIPKVLPAGIGLMAAVLALAGCATGPAGTGTASQAPLAFTVKGLEEPAEVLVDRWGVPHMYAGTTYDAFVAQGFMAARDRLWQMDLWRKRGLGEMARDFGPAWVESDRMARAVLFRGDMYREWLAYGSDSKRVAEAFVAGVNAYVAQAKANPALLPTEFKLLGYQPSAWSAEDVVRIRHHGLTLNFTSEVDRALALCGGEAGARTDWLRRELDPPITPKLADGLDACALPAAELKKSLRPGHGGTPVQQGQHPAGRRCRCRARHHTAGGPGRCRHSGQLRQQQLGDCPAPDQHWPSDPGQRPAPRARRAQPALHGPPERIRHGRDWCGRALSARRVHRA